MGYVLQDVLAGSEHFQSVTGDKKKVEVGQKRRRIQAEHFSPVFEVKKTIRPKLITRERERAKHELKKAKRQEIRNKLQKTKSSTNRRSERLKPEIELGEKGFADGEEEHLDDDDDDEEENEVSPFDPTNICTDTLVPLNNRRLYVDEFYQNECSIPKLNFVNSPDHQVMLNQDSAVLYEDNIAYHIINDYRKNYKSLPVSFPPLYSPNSSEVNPYNKLRVRFLLYPQHYEVFLLAAPKSNELDPIYEITKLIMIHYALYFSHSEEIKKEMMEYCEKIESSIEENNFSEFMFLIDKWNLLMLELSPNSKEVEKIKTEETDVNKLIRTEYLSPQERKTPKLDDLNLELYYSNLSHEASSPAFNVLTKVANLNSTEVVHKHNVIEPGNVSDTLRYTKPEDYNANFFKHLQKKSDISRFAMHQIMLRIYSRVVSTDSRKLRSYKAFTAEVYGELLPSFTSEVLEKVQLKPNQKFYDLGSGVGNTTFQAALEFGAKVSGGCEIMEHASKLCSLQSNLMSKHLSVFGLRELNFDFALLQSFVDNEPVRKAVLDCDVLIINNYLFDVNLNTEVGRMLYGLKTGTKIISLRNFIRPRYRFTGDSIFDRLRVEKHEMSDFLSVSWTANKVPYYISTVEETILPEYLGHRTSSEEPSVSDRTSISPVKLESSISQAESMDIDNHANETKWIGMENSSRNDMSIMS
jgi:H3 lysine-79-specific histone-lysine N-methyltransferase